MPRTDWTAVSLLWVSGAGLRLTVLAVPPVIALIQLDLGLSGTQIGILSGLPIILFAVAAVPGSLLIARFGALRTLVFGLILAGVASGLRGAVPNIWVLYTFTILMGAGIAVMQPALPSLVREWLPRRIGFGTAVYINGLLVGETLPVALTLPLLFPLIAGSWQISLAIWGAPLLVMAAVVLWLAPRPDPAAPRPTALPLWRPDWRSSLVWRLGLIVSSVNGVYFGANTFLPGHLTQAGHPELISAALTAINAAQLPASFLLLGVAGRLERKAWPFVLTGLLMLGAIVGIMTTASIWTVVWAAVVGFCTAFGLALGLALPALLAAPRDVARTAGAMFTISYGVGVLMSVIAGAVWDLTGDARFAFVPLAIGALPQILLIGTINFRPAEPQP
jgi:CP family cyanate transporter-like MFS transporter